MNRLHQLHDAGVSIWLDTIRRSLLTSGRFQQMVAEDALSDEKLDHVDHEERVALGALMNCLRQGRHKRTLWKTDSEIFTDGGLAEKVEGYLLALAMRQKLVFDEFKRMRTEVDIFWSIGGNYEHPSRLAAPGQQRHEVEGGIVTPVEILQYEHEGFLGS